MTLSLPSRTARFPALLLIVCCAPAAAERRTANDSVTAADPLLAAPPAGAGANREAPQPGPESLISAFVDAWNAHQAQGFERLFTEQAVWVPIAEVRDEGRAAIVQDLAAAHASWAGKTTIAPFGPSTVRIPKPGVATLFFRVKFLDAQGQPIAGIERALLLVAVQTAEGWRIAAGQLTKESPAPK
ncbi:SgcJ/EcaC family oxidoreductase [Pseudoxanthomonas winnipegensis]|uniref:YybH family protein n=1 Tax=Pseudoxanthomonas winnipegensis TaxID=2480810 RepID=UPI0030F3710B